MSILRKIGHRCGRKSIAAILLFSTLCFPGYIQAADGPLRIGVFDRQGLPGGNEAKPASWYRNELEKSGFKVLELKEKDMADPELLSRKALDILILPDGENIPYESAYLIPKFLSGGGHLITTALPAAGWKQSSAPSARSTGNMEKSPIIYTWKMNPNPDCQLRFLNWKSAQRSLNTELKLNPGLPAAIKDGLPPAAIPLNTTFGLPDKFNMFRSAYVDGKRESRDLNCGGGGNAETAGNIILPVYCLPSGEPTDFLAYRYHNCDYNGATLVHLGKTGGKLMESDAAGNVLRACVRLCLEPYPGEQTAEWYGRLLEVQRKVSELGGDFIDAYYGIRDKMTAAFYTGAEKDASRLEREMRALLDGLSTVLQEKQALDALLLNGAEPETQDRRRKALLQKLNGERRKCREALAAAGKLPIPVGTPEKIEVKNPLGRMPVEAGHNGVGVYGFSANAHTLEKLGVTTLKTTAFFYSSLPGFPQRRLNLDAVGLMGGGFPLPRQGKLDITTGKVEETRKDEYHPEKLRNFIKERVERYSGAPVIRYYGGSEGGLNNNYWGEQARLEYISYLKDKYGEISKLNARWWTSYGDFADIRLMTRRPETAPEHANWEDWSKFRETQLFNARDRVYKLFKQYAPGVLYSAYISTGCRNHPTYGVNYYELTKIQDISGIDGTALPVPMEWTYLDLVADNKKVWTMEWSAFYFPPENKPAGRERLRKQLWQEVSGGHIGINLWLWSFPGFSGNFMDMNGLPTQYGWELKQLAADFRKFEHVLLDGNRLEPEIRLLFSNTSRTHDQPWVAWGKRPFSPHLAAMDNLYGNFVKLKFPVRALDEGALIDGASLEKCRLLIVPQAQYLSREVQDKLLDYTRNGGNLVISGDSGKYDNYGNDSDPLLKRLGIVPGTVKTGELQLPDGRIGDARFKDMIYAPLAAEKGETLAAYKSGEPALTGMNFGRGNVFVAGLPLSALDLQGLETVMENLFKAADYMPKYRCNDQALVLREWEYNGDLYLICAYPAGGKMINQFDLSIRGRWEVEDYLLGVNIPAGHEKGYSRFKGVILSPGGRVYRLKPKSPDAAVNGMGKPGTSAGKIPDQPAAGTAGGGILPYHGELLQENGEVEIGGYKFRIAVAVEKYFEKGKLFLSVRKDAEELSRELTVEKPAIFVFKDKAVRVTCRYPIYNYPEGAVVAMEEIAAPELESECRITSDGTAKALANGMLELKTLPDKGGKITGLNSYPEAVNHIGPDGITEIDNDYPGSLSSRPFAVEREEATGEACSLVMAMGNAAPNGLLARKTFAMKAGIARTDIEIELANKGNRAWKGTLRIHPVLNVGGTADGDDVFYIPAENGVEAVRYTPGDGGNHIIPAAGWAACCDSRKREAYISTFDPDDVDKVYIWMDGHFYNLELMGKKVRLEKDETLFFRHGVSLVKGVSGIGGYAGGWAGNLIVPAEKWSQREKMDVVFESGNVHLEKQRVTVRIFLRQAGKTIQTCYEDKAAVSYEHPLRKELKVDFGGLSEGNYELTAAIEGNDGEILTVAKTIILPGGESEKDQATFALLRERVDAYKNKSVPPEWKYDAVMALEKLKAAMECRDATAIRYKQEELEKLLSRQ